MAFSPSNSDGHGRKLSFASMFFARSSNRIEDEEFRMDVGNIANRVSIHSPICSPISVAFSPQNASYDLSFISDVEAARDVTIAGNIEDDLMPVMIERTSFPISLKFVDVRYSVTMQKEEKEILHGITGSIAPGEMLALMGPSGGGKTTLLTVLGGRAAGNISGTITYSDQLYSKSLKRRVGFVTQDDILYPHLTVRETLMYAALLRLPKSLTKQQKIERAEEVIKQLRLDRCRDTIIGNALLRGVSGGERRRVCIGHEILIDPSLILLDEPTSGLDSTTALLTMQILQNIAVQGGRTVVTTIHQPSSRLFHIFDKLILLSEGHPIYFGKAMDAMSYFSSIGFSPLIPMNPAEFFLDLCTGNTTGISVSHLLEQQSFSNDSQTNFQKKEDVSPKPSPNDVKQYLIDSCGKKIISKQRIKLSAIHENPHSEKLKADTREWTTTWWTQFVVLMERGFRQRRHDYLNPVEIVQVVVISIVTGLLWWQKKPNNLLHLQDQMGLIFFFTVLWSFSPCLAAIFTFAFERAVVAKERATDMYRLSAYFLASNLGDLPLNLALPAIFTIIIYFMAHLKMTATAFFLTLLAVFLTVLTAQGIGLFIGAAVMDIKKASAFCFVLSIIFMLSGGFYLQGVPSFMRWMKDISLYNYSYNLLVKVQYDADEKYNCSSPSGCESISSSPALRGIRLGGIAEDICVLIIMIFGFRVLAYLALRYPKNLI